MVRVPTFGIIAFIGLMANNGRGSSNGCAGAANCFESKFDDENPPDRPKSELTGSNVLAKRPKFIEILQIGPWARECEAALLHQPESAVKRPQV